jgi:hypothetical protein
VSHTSGAQSMAPSTSLRDKVGGGSGALDPAVLAKAEAALKALSGQFGQWLDDEIAKLEAARADIGKDGMTVQTGDRLYMRAHDLKGLGGTYEFPIVSRISASLCRLIDDQPKRAKAPLFLIDAHIQAIKAAVRDNIRDEANPIGRALAEALEAQVRTHFG